MSTFVSQRPRRWFFQQPAPPAGRYGPAARTVPVVTVTRPQFDTAYVVNQLAAAVSGKLQAYLKSSTYADRNYIRPGSDDSICLFNSSDKAMVVKICSDDPKSYYVMTEENHLILPAHSDREVKVNNLFGPKRGCIRLFYIVCNDRYIKNDNDARRYWESKDIDYRRDDVYPFLPNVEIPMGFDY